MKKLVSVLIFAVFLFGPELSAQKLTEGPSAPVVKKVGYQQLIGSDDTGFYVLKRSSTGKGIAFLVEKFSNKNFSQIFSKETKVEETQEGMMSARVMEIYVTLSQGKVYVFFPSFDKKHKKLYFFLQTVSSTGEVSQIYEVSSSYLEPMTEIAFAGRSFFRVSFSPDKKLFTVVPLLGEKEGSNNLVCSIYDAASLQKKADKVIPSEGLRADDFTVDNNANLFYSIKKNVRQGKLDGFGVGLIENASPTAKVFNLELPDQSVFHDYAFKALANGDILITGIISDTLAKGTDSAALTPLVYVKRISANTLATQYELRNEIDPAALKQLGTGRRNDSYGQTEIFEMNGSIYIVTEKINAFTVYKPFANMSLPFTTTHNKELLVSKMAADGKFLWTKVIAKKHENRGLLAFAEKPPRYSGNVKMFEVDNKLNFVFLDSPENKDFVERTDSKDIKAIHGNPYGSENVVAKDKPNAVCVTLDENGNLSKKTFLEFSEEGVYYITIGNTVMLTPKKLLLFLENRGEKVEKFATLDF